MRAQFLTAMLASVALIACGQTSAPAPAATTAAAPAEVAATTLPTEIGGCVDTVVESHGPRLEGVADSGSAITYENGLIQVSYDVVPGIDHSQPGDAAHVCLVSVPENCPPGDDRGKVYTVTNGRTGESWTAPDSQHTCGGA